MTPGSALAAVPGCTALNGTYTAGAISGSTSGTGFSAGDTITLNVIAAGGVDDLGLYDNTNHTILLPITNAFGTRTYRVGADTAANFSIVGSQANNASSFSWSCVAGGSSTGSTDSDKLKMVQVMTSKIVGNTSGIAISSSVNVAIASSLNIVTHEPSTVSASGDIIETETTPWNRIGTNIADARPPGARRTDDAFAALGYAAVTKAPPRKAAVFVPQWSTWADVRGSGFDRSDSRAINGTQINATGGITYRLRPDFVVGAFAGYENFNYDVASLTGNLKGNGGTIGTYAGWAITPTLRWTGLIGWTGLGYDVSAGTAAGGFDGSRWLLSTGLTGSQRVATFILEPSVDVFALWERQSSYTDTLGALHDARNFSTGRVALGGRALAPIQGVRGVTPYLGFYGDFRFSTNSTVPASGVAFVGLSDGWSGRVTGGVNVAVAGGGTLALGGEYGGIGRDYGIWTGNARLNLPF